MLERSGHSLSPKTNLLQIQILKHRLRCPSKAFPQNTTTHFSPRSQKSASPVRVRFKVYWLSATHNLN